MVTRSLALYVVALTACGGGSSDGSTSPSSAAKADGVHCYAVEAVENESRCFANSADCESALHDHGVIGDSGRLGDCKRPEAPATCFDVFDDDADATQRRCFATEAHCSSFVTTRGFDSESPPPPCSSELKPIPISQRGVRAGQFVAATPPDEPAGCGRVASRLESLELREGLAVGGDLQGLEAQTDQVRNFIDAKSTEATNDCEVPAESDPNYVFTGGGEYETGIAACDRLIATYLSCDKLPKEAKDAMLQASRAWKEAARTGGASSRQAIEQACTQAEVATKQALKSTGC
jgi:hypothetical protein